MEFTTKLISPGADCSGLLVCILAMADLFPSRKREVMFIFQSSKSEDEKDFKKASQMKIKGNVTAKLRMVGLS